MDIERTRKMLAVEEGRRTKAYPDTEGILTIGIGHNLKAKPWIFSRTREKIPIDYAKAALLQITERQVDWLFDADFGEAVEITRRMLDKDCGAGTFEGLDDVRQAALAAITFQAGYQPGETMRLIAAGEYVNAAWRIRTRWKMAQGKTKARTERLAQMIETGEWIPGYGGDK